jgi:hypothetical protein
MKQNWSKFFTQYTVLLVIGSLVIVASLLYIDNKDKLTSNSNNLQERKEITIKKTYRDISVHEYNDDEYVFDNETTDSNDSKNNTGNTQTTYETERLPNATPGNSLTVKTSKKTTTATTSKKRGLNGRNPYAIEYANAIKEYTALAKRAEVLKTEKKVASGDARYEINNELRQMKPAQVNITNKLKSAQKKYRAWEKNH